MTQAKFAEIAKVSRSNITYFLRGGAPRDSLFQALFTVWQDMGTATTLFQAHVRDEAERGGLNPDLVNQGGVSVSELLTIEDDLHTLRRLLITDADVRPFIRKMAADARATAHAKTGVYPVIGENKAYGLVAEDLDKRSLKKRKTPPNTKD